LTLKERDMAEVLNEFAFVKGAPKRVYPWDEWLDGQVWRLTRGEDFNCLASSFQCMVSRVAKVRGLLCSTAREGDDAVIVQAFKPNGKK